jgi:hypothetical protein
MENIFIGFLFLIAVSYLLRLVYNQFNNKNPVCAKNCGGACGLKINLPQNIKEN